MQGSQETSQERFDYLFKIVMIGDTSVGKSNLLRRLTTNDYNADSKPTIGVEFGTRMFTFGGDTVRVQIWDTAGQERYRAITTAYYRGSNGAVVVYDVASTRSFQNAFILWLKELHAAIGTDVPIIIIGNKTDLKQHREVEREQGETRAISAGLNFYETSALTGENVEETFEAFARQIYDSQKEKMKVAGKAKVQREDLAGIEISGNKGKKRSSSCC